MKASLINTLAEAKSFSLKHPNVMVYVVDKKRCKPKYFTSEWAMRQCFYEGYGPVTKFKNGVDLGK